MILRSLLKLLSGIFICSFNSTNAESPSPFLTNNSQQSLSASQSISITPTNSPSGICYSIQNQLFGTFETVSGDTTYYINHGGRIEHYNSPSNTLISTSTSCSIQSNQCVCNYVGGELSLGCTFNRYAIITYKYGTQTKTVYDGQNPPCAYYFTSTLMLPSSSRSITPSNSISPSMSSSKSISPSQSQTKSTSPSQSQTNSITPTISYSPSESSIFFTSRYSTQTSTSFETPNSTSSQTPTITNTPAFIKTAFPTINKISPTSSTSPLLMALPYPSATNTPHLFEASDNPTESKMGKAAIGASGVAVGGILAYTIQQIIQKFRKPSTINNQNQDNKEYDQTKRMKDKLDKLKKIVEEEDKIQIVVEKDDLFEIENFFKQYQKNYQIIS